MIRGLMTDDEWAIVAPFLIIPRCVADARQPSTVWTVVWMTPTPWRDLPEAFGNWNSMAASSAGSVWRMGCAVCRGWPIATVILDALLLFTRLIAIISENPDSV